VFQLAMTDAQELGGSDQEAALGLRQLPVGQADLDQGAQPGTGLALVPWPGHALAVVRRV